MPETPEEDPDATCSEEMKKKPDFHYCNRESFPLDLVATVGDQIMILKKRYSCIKDFNPEEEAPPEDWREIWECVGQQQTHLEKHEEELVHITEAEKEALLGLLS